MGVNSATTSLVSRLTNQKWGRLFIVLLGISIGQFILYGPSLVGSKILLPLDVLEMPNYYTPAVPGAGLKFPHDSHLSDPVLAFEPQRQFANGEIRAGRFPIWAPYQYTGAPVVWPKFSPFLMAEYLVSSPIVLAWVQLAAAVIAGLGFYFFCRRAMGLHFWPAAIVAWCYPLTGFFIFWAGYPTGLSVYWLPWLLLAVDRACRGGGLLALVRLSIATCLVLISGHVDIAGQVLLVSGLYALWCLWHAHGRQLWHRRTSAALMTLTAGWLLGFCLASPALLPLIEYAPTGARMEHRSAGHEERPPAGVSALPQVVLPDMYGTGRQGSFYLLAGNQMESSAAAYAGMLATLFAAPLAWCSRRHRSLNVFWCLLGFFALSWCLNVPGLVTLLRLPGLNMMSHNRLVFALAYGILAMAGIGLDALLRDEVQQHGWFWIPIVLLAGFFIVCAHRAAQLPEPLHTSLPAAVAEGSRFDWIQNAADVALVQSWFTRTYVIGGGLCLLTLTAWWLLKVRPLSLAKNVPWFGIFLVADLLWFAHDRSAQCDPQSYYPRIPALEAVAKSVPGRVMGSTCFPATLAEVCGLSDVRGYDSIDPKRITDLLNVATDTRYASYDYALDQWLTPQTTFLPPDGVQLLPALDMLGVRYVIFRGEPPEGLHPLFQSDDYWVLVNSNALPRSFVPAHVETISSDSDCLDNLASPLFNPREVAYALSPVNLPEHCRGMVEIVSEIPTRINLSPKMETPGLVVLADLWDKGWHARLNGQAVPIMRVNYALRGVVVPPGNSELEFYYRPESFIRGLQLCGAAAGVLATLLGLNLWRSNRPAGV